MKLSRRIFLFNMLSICFAFGIACLVYAIAMAVSSQLSMTTKVTDTLEQELERKSVFAQLEQEVRNLGSEQLTSELQEAMTARVQQVGSEMAIVKDRKLIASSREMNQEDLAKLLNGITYQTDVIKLSDQNVRYHVITMSKAQADLILLYPDQNRSFSIWMNIIIALVTFLIVYTLLSAWISRKITQGLIRPIQRLKQAAIQISEGELNSIIPEEGNGELLELCQALEQMRIKLKESIYLQQKYDQNRSFLVSSISHDLKTPVTSIKGYIEGILDGVANTAEKRERYLLTAHRKAVLINSMIEDLLLYSKLDLKQMPFNKQRIDFVNYIRDGIQENIELLHADGVRLETDIENIKERMVLLDGDRFMRVFQNIIDNALNYNHQQEPVISIMLRETYTSIILEVKDNGIGMKEEETKRIFDRFYRSDQARSVDSGSGLGLAIAKQIVEAHHGQIWAKSQQGAGTSILISLPKSRG